MFTAVKLVMMKSISGLIAVIALCTVSTQITLFAGGEEVVVIYNSNLPESKTLAEYYASHRGVPDDQVWGFALTSDELISRTAFNNTLQTPLLDRLRSKRLWKFERVGTNGTGTVETSAGEKLVESSIRYAVLCYGVPLRIYTDANLVEPGVENLRPELRRNDAAVDSELACLPLWTDKYRISGPLPNRVRGATNTALFSPTNGVLMVTRLDGPSVEIARGLVDKALLAETNGLWGRAYIDLRDAKDGAFKPGDDWMRAASEACRFEGFETVVDDKPSTFPASFPMSQIGFYCGWYAVNASGPFTLPDVEFMPGAFAYHLHSYSAKTLRSTNEWWVGPLLAKGATATMGCVAEPYLAGTPEVGLFTARFLLGRFTFGEAAYAAQPYLSWQTTVVGDPLYRPFGKELRELHAELEARHSKLAEWSNLFVVNQAMARGFPPANALRLVEDLPLTKQSAVLSEKLAELCDALGKPSSAIAAYEQALKLDPTREQRIRLRLTLGEKLLAAGEERDAYDDYKKLIEEWPAYPGAIEVYQKLISLAGKVGRRRDVNNWEEQIKNLTPPKPSTNDSAISK